MIHRTGKRAKHTTRPYTAVSNATNGNHDAMDQDEEMVVVCIKYQVKGWMLMTLCNSNPKMRQ